MVFDSNKIRNPDRIEEVLGKIEDYWKDHPDLRLAQIIVNLCGPGTKDPFPVEDTEILANLGEPMQADPYWVDKEEVRENQWKREDIGGHKPPVDPDWLIEKAKRQDMVLDFNHRIGARPFMRYTPYINERGVKNHMWSCISIFPKYLPGGIVWTYPRIVDPSEHDDYEVNIFTDEWVKGQIRHAVSIRLRHVHKTPFGELFKGWVK